MTISAETRLAFRLPDFTRYSWVTDKARTVWEPRVQQVLNCWTEIEWRSVTEGQRTCTLRVVSPEELVSLAPIMARYGLIVLPLAMQGISSQPYNNTATAYRAGEPFTYHAVIGAPRHAMEFHDAYHIGDQDALGRLLGYPQCCRQFFQRVWIDEQRIDTTWSMAINTQDLHQDGLVCEVSGDPGANILLRWLGVRAVPHLPCAFDCQSTSEHAQYYVALGRQLGYETEMAWLDEMLSWPVEWSALHGIAEIKTPVVKISSCTDATSHKYVVRRAGVTYPAEGAQGLVFPFRQPIRLTISSSSGFRRGIEHPLTVKDTTTPKPAWYYIDNCFSTELAMKQAHKPIVDLVTSTLKGSVSTVLDLGCGNGALLREICRKNTVIVPYGIDLNPVKIDHAHQLMPEYRANFWVGDMFEAEQMWTEGRRYTLILGFFAYPLEKVH